jgi:hypothetical protein
MGGWALRAASASVPRRPAEQARPTGRTFVADAGYDTSPAGTRGHVSLVAGQTAVRSTAP